MTIYAVFYEGPRALHPEDAAKVLTDNTGEMYFLDRTEDQDGEHVEKIFCYDSLQKAWRAIINREEGFVHDAKDRLEWVVNNAIRHGYVPSVETPAAKMAWNYACAWTIEYHRLMKETK